MTSLKNKITAIFSEVLLASENELDTSAELASIGVDSILAAQLAKILNKEFDITLSPIDLFESITIEGLVRHISEHYPILASTEIKPDTSAEKIVIVGMACRFPQSDSKEVYWDNLLDANNCITKTNRWETSGRTSTTGGFLEDISLFDASFFRISPNEARCMDPQQRILLEVTQHAIEDANITLNELRAQNCGVFVTSLPGDYKFEMTKDPEKAFSTYSFSGNAFSALSGRISYFYDFKGPSLNIDTACSSSITAIHQAYLNIMSGSCKAAIVGGVAVFSTPEIFEFAERSNMSSASGRCRVFDNEADGFVPSEGAASVILMKESEALRLNLKIYGSIEGIESNHDGQSNGLMAPNSQSQAQLIKKTFQKHNLSLRQLAYIEAHGTGTKLGDPIEVQGLTQALKALDTDYDLYLGASKAVIGHTLVCSGLASIIKVLMAFRHQAIPPMPEIPVKNEHIDFGHFQLNTKPVNWPDSKPLAAISAFGFTGSNSHLILSQYPQHADMPEVLSESGVYSFCFAAHTESSLKEKLQQYISFAESLNEQDLSILSEQLYARHQGYDLRLAIVARSLEELKEGLRQALSKPSFSAETLLIEMTPVHQLTEKQFSRLSMWMKKEEETGPMLPYTSAPLSLPAYPFDRKSYWITETFVQEEKKQNDSQPQSYRTEVLAKLKESIMDLLGYDESQVKIDKPLHEYGIDSLSAIQLLAPFKQLSVKLKPQDLFEFDSLNALADEIVRRSDSSDIQIEQKPQKRKATGLTKRPGVALQQLPSSTSKRLIWQTAGSGDQAILLLPPLNTSHKGWTQQLKFLSKMGYQVYIPVYPGHSQNEFSDEHFDIQAIVDEIHEFVRKELGQNSVPFMGWSLGGCICMQLAERFPDLIESMVLISTAAKFDKDIFEKTIDLHQEVELHKTILEIVLGNEEPILQTISAGADLSVLKHYYDFLENFDMSQQLSSFHMPVLIVSGQDDPVIIEENISLLQHIPNHELMILENQGHFIPLTASRLFNERIKEFIISSKLKLSHSL